MNHLIQQNNLEDQIVCDSAGTGGWHVGNPPDRRMAAAARQKLGITLQGNARQFHKLDFEKFDLILAMDKENYATLLQLDTHQQHRNKIKLMCDYCQIYGDREVPDPYYGGPEGFNYVIDLLMDACSGLLEDIRRQISN